MAGVSLGFKTSPQGVDVATLDATWTLAGGLAIYDTGWLNDHLTHPGMERGGASLEPLTLLAALAHRVPGKRVGVAVLSNTFRHPSLLAKQAIVLDQVTGGRFILGLGAGWHEGEHDAFGVRLPPLKERFDRYESALRVLHTLFSPQAAGPPGVDLDDPFVPLHGATNEPGTIRPGGPEIWLGGQRARGLALAARYADGWLMPGDRAGDDGYFVDRRDALMRALDAGGRDPARFEVAGQIASAPDAKARRASVEAGLAMARAGATHIIVGVSAAGGPSALDAATREIAVPLREALA
ncbi:MAG TPA: LLM class flavin-dependent oxidoreductase [Candidatus Dormibacteraeota bacterium]|nr:LLM class flavin-dependent oxidoreductase [Candidatus Dormibacteraeota bacterium]